MKNVDSIVFSTVYKIFISASFPLILISKVDFTLQSQTCELLNITSFIHSEIILARSIADEYFLNTLFFESSINLKRNKFQSLDTTFYTSDIYFP